ncbi:unnamed protein product [Mesocestoides corti]|uniref:Mediator complex subunit 9 n=1 Tax=Mesocestoides corti TaxID=53468 RepID=A0A0R3UN43_MESCO|nr:unnamed protein product [Mesocestoides corti]
MDVDECSSTTPIVANSTSVAVQPPTPPPNSPQQIDAPTSKPLHGDKTDHEGDHALPLTATDRMAHEITQQVQMIACVLRSVERISTEKPSPDDATKLQIAQQDALSYLAFLRDRYAGILRSFAEE